MLTECSIVDAFVAMSSLSEMILPLSLDKYYLLALGNLTVYEEHLIKGSTRVHERIVFRNETRNFGSSVN